MPECIQCGDEYSEKRQALGYKTCLKCGSPPVKVLLQDVSKSNPVVTLRAENVVSSPYARQREGASVLKSGRDYVSLGNAGRLKTKDNEPK